MTVLNIEVNKREYEIACSDGEEDQIMRLSYELDKRIKELSKAVGTGNQSTLLVIAALQLLDELHESRQNNTGTDVSAEIATATSSTLSQVSSQIEDLAKKLEKKAS